MTQSPTQPAAPISISASRHDRIWGGVLLLAGIAALCLPFAAGLGVTMLSGWLLGIAGVVQGFAAWSNRRRGAAIWQVLLGLLYVAAAVWLLREPVSSLASLTLVIAALLIAESIWQLLWWWRLRHRTGAWILLCSALLSLLLGGAIVASWPFSAIWVVGTLLGIGLILAGISRLLHWRLGQSPVPIAAPLP